MARPRVPVITDPEPYVVIAEIHCSKLNSHAQVRFYQRRTARKPRQVLLHLAALGKPCATVEEASEQLLVAMAHYVRLLGPRK